MTNPSIDPQVIEEAAKALDGYIERQRKRGATVEVRRPLYHEGLTNVRCVLVINGETFRMYFRPATGRWVRPSS